MVDYCAGRSVRVAAPRSQDDPLEGSIMAQFKISLVLVALSAYSASAATIVNGTLPDFLTYASVTVPSNPNEAFVPLIISKQTYDQAFTFTVSGATGTGILLLRLSLWAVPYIGFDYPQEQMTSCSDLTISSDVLANSLYLQTFPAALDGCNPTAPPIGFNINFGQPVTIEFKAESTAAYSFATMIPLLPPISAGYKIESWVEITGVSVLDSNLQTVSNAVVDVQSIPEPATATGFAIAIALISGSRYLRLWRRSSR